MAKIKLCCLFGGASEEHEVSLVSAHSVLSQIDVEKYEITTVGITKAGKWLLFEGALSDLTAETWQNFATKEVILPATKGAGEIYILEGDSITRRKIDVVFPIMHGKNCEDGTLQGLFELCGIPFVGPGCLSSAVCMDKASTKMILKNYGIPQAAALAVDAVEIRKMPSRIALASEALGSPLFVKPSASGSSCGVSRVNTPSELLPALEKALLSDSRVLIEECIKGAEVEVAVLGNADPIVSIPGEIAPGNEFYDYDTKYKNDTASYYIPARISDSAMAKVRQYAQKIYKILGCKGLARVDFFVDGERVVFNEINTLPGFTSISMYPKMMEASGIPYAELIDRLIQLAME